MREITGKCPLGSECVEQKEINSEKVLVRCPWSVKIRGKDPQSEQEIDEWRCAIAWMPLLQIEHSLFERQTGAATEQVRNALSDVGQSIRMIGKPKEPKLIEG